MNTHWAAPATFILRLRKSMQLRIKYQLLSFDENHEITKTNIHSIKRKQSMHELIDF